MKRRGFLKRVAVLAATAVVAPAALAGTYSPAQAPVPFKRPDAPNGQFDSVQRMKGAMNLSDKEFLREYQCEWQENKYAFYPMEVECEITTNPDYDKEELDG